MGVKTEIFVNELLVFLKILDAHIHDLKNLFSRMLSTEIFYICKQKNKTPETLLHLTGKKSEVY